MSNCAIVVLPRSLSPHPNSQLGLLDRTHGMIRATVTDYSRGIDSIDPAHDELYQNVYSRIRNGQLALQLLDDLILDMSNLLGRCERFCLPL